MKLKFKPRAVHIYLSSITFFMCLGVFSGHHGLFPAPQLRYILNQARSVFGVLPVRNWYYLEHDDEERISVVDLSRTYEELTLITTIDENRSLRVKVIDLQGEEIYRWTIDWFEIWPDADHIPFDKLPKARPGTHIHGSKILSNGDIIFNFENLGLVKLDACGSTIWKLAQPTHHSIHVAENGDIWLPGQVNYNDTWDEFPSFKPPFKDDTILQVSASGKIKSQQSLMKLLRINGLDGLMFMSTLKSRNPSPSGDLFHMNDVELFPEALEEGFFKHGDVLISLRNINTVLVYEPNTLKIKFISIGRFVRQHDPDFIDGNTISIYDNNNVPGSTHKKSRVLLLSATSNDVKIVFEGSEEVPFFSNIMGKHQWLPNGNLLLLESMNGRLMELSPEFDLVWEYNNILKSGNSRAIMEGGERLGANFDVLFFESIKERCGNNKS